MTEENFKDDISSHSIGFMSHRQNQRLDIALEDKDSQNKEQNDLKDNENKTQFNFNKIPNPLVNIEQPKRANSCEKRKKNKILEKKMKEILNYREKFKSLEMEEKLEEEEIKKEESEKKKKVESKVNRNLKLLSLIREKMSQNCIKDEQNNEKGNENKIENNNNVEVKKEIIEKDNNKEENSEDDIKSKTEEKKKEEEKRNKLLKLFDRKNSRDIDNNKNENKDENKNIEKKEDKEINKEKESDKVNKYQKIKIPAPNSGSVSYPMFMKKGAGNFQINTPKTKLQNKKNISKSNSKEKEPDNNLNIQSNNKNQNESKYSEIPIEQKNKLTINIIPKNISYTQDESNKSSNQNSNVKEKNSSKKEMISLSNKKEENKNIKNNIKTDNKKGAMKILELLKEKKKEEKESEKNDKNKEGENKDQINDNKNVKEENLNSLSEKKVEDKKNIKNQKHKEENIYDTRSLPKKKFREEDEENNYSTDDKFSNKNDNKYTKTQHYFKKSNQILNNINNFNYNEKNFNNNSNRIKTNYYNNINNNINNYFNLGEAQNYNDRKTLDYIDSANLFRNKIQKKIKAFNSTNQFLNEENDEDDDNIFRVGNKSHINYIQNKNSMINNNTSKFKNLDKSYDMFRTINNPIRKREVNKNKTVKIYKQKKIINNNSPKNVIYRPYEKNLPNNYERNGRIYNKLSYKRQGHAYIKKSPGRIINPKISNENNRKQNKIVKTTKNNNFEPIPKGFNKSNINTIINKNYNIGRNEGMEISTINYLNSSIDTNISNKTNNKNNKLMENQKENTMIFNLEDLLILEEKLNNITFALESNKNVESQCFNFWNYYFNCSLYKILEKIFPNEEDANIIRLSTNYELMSIMVCYDFAFGNNVDDEDLNLSLIELIYFNHNNLMIISEYILTKISQKNTDNIWVLKLQEIIKNSKFSQSKEIKNGVQFSPIQKISNNTNKIIKKIKSILLNYQSDSSALLKNYILNLPNKTYSEINSFFRSHILRIYNDEGSLVPPSYFKQNMDFIPIPAPYLKFPSAKQYTLILDLDETLVSFQIKSKKEGTLRARPYLFAFLEEMGHYYELIVWTSATESYANSLVEAIEYDKQYFDFILFREHAIIIGDEFVKDLTRVGRGLDRIIIVDDMPQNFRLQKQNGITIKPFFGDDYNDSALYDLLPILKRIAEEGNDVRIELAKYRNEILKKITSNISLNNI